MHTIVNPKQTNLFDPFDNVLTEKTRKRLLDSWPGVFRHTILELMPVGAVSGHFDPTMGRPTKELYSMAGLLLIKEFMNLTKQEALDAYSYHMDIQYALNLAPVAQDISIRTLERYIDLFGKDTQAKTVIGSGAVEGACKNIVGKRLKQSGITWTRLGSSSVLALRVSWLNEEWEQLWRKNPLAA